MDTLKSIIQNDVKEAMRNKDSLRLETLRMLTSSIKQREIDTRVDGATCSLDDSQVIVIINKMIKQRQESALQYHNNGRQELADKEEAEIQIIQKYLPQQLTEEEILLIIENTIRETNASSMKDMAKVMQTVKDKVQGKADVGKVSSQVKQMLTNN